MNKMGEGSKSYWSELLQGPNNYTNIPKVNMQHNSQPEVSD